MEFVVSHVVEDRVNYKSVDLHSSPRATTPTPTWDKINRNLCDRELITLQ